MRRLFVFLGVVATTAFGTMNLAYADTPSKRHLVYTFSVGVLSDQHAQSSAVSYSGLATGHTDSSPVFGTGDTSYKGNASDKGEITVDYQGIEADGGLVVSVAEAARTNRTAPATTCVIYANTNVLCAGSNVYPEELSVVRALSPRFFDPSALDKNRHWKVSAGNGVVVIDFTATPTGTGLVSIDSQRVEKTKSGDTTQATAQYDYDFTKFVPTTLKEYTTMRQETGVGQYTNITIDVRATLTSDSLAESH
jgi:hypothetical protein